MAFFQNNLGKLTQEDEPFWILLVQEMMGWELHQLGHMQIICTCSRQITMPVPHHSSLFTGWMPFLLPNQQCQSTNGIINK